LRSSWYFTPGIDATALPPGHPNTLAVLSPAATLVPSGLAAREKRQRADHGQLRGE
jgi:hypothetical protein